MARVTITTIDGRTLYQGDHDSPGEAVAHCAAQGIALDGADLRGYVLDGQDLSGLFAPNCDLTGASLVGVVANRLVKGRQLELSAALLDGAVIEDCDFAVANLSCTRPTTFKRCVVDSTTRLRGIDWSDCSDVIVLPVKDDRVGKVVALHDGRTWNVHAGERGVLAEALAKQTLEALPNDQDIGRKYQTAFAYLESPEGQQRKAAIEASAVDFPSIEVAGAKG